MDFAIACRATETSPPDLPRRWGLGGALFAFSGFDGTTDWYHPLVSSTSSQGRGIDFHTETPLSVNVRLPVGWNDVSFEDEVVAGDIISSTIVWPGHAVRIRYLFLDHTTVIGELRVLRSEQSLATGLTVSAEGAETVTDGASCLVRTNEELFVLTAQGSDVRACRDGLSVSLRANGASVFALAYGYGCPLENVRRRAISALSTDLGAAFEKRKSFFAAVPAPPVTDTLLRECYYKCISVQKVNCCTAQGAIKFDWTTPDRYPHRHMWIWDSAFHALGLRHFAPEWAHNAIKAVLSKQGDDGFVPHMMTPEPSKDSGIIQPPILAWAALKVHETTGDEDFLRYCYPRIRKMVLWDIRNRDRDHDGLCEWESGGASGMDNSPRFDRPIGASVDLNSYLINDMACLEMMASMLGFMEDVLMWQQMRADFTARLNSLLWDPETAFYYDLDPEGKQVKLKTEAGFTPLFAGVCSDSQAAALVQHLTNPNEFWREFPVASVSADEPSFCDDMWRGPVWINYNYLVIEGLIRYGYGHVARELRKKTLRHIARWYAADGVVYEFYDSEGTASPSVLRRKGHSGVRLGNWQIGQCIRDYHWTAALYNDLIMRSDISDSDCA